MITKGFLEIYIYISYIWFFIGSAIVAVFTFRDFRALVKMRKKKKKEEEGKR